MKHIHDILRERLLSTVEAAEAAESLVFDLDALRESEWSTRFETLMRNRLLMGAFRYGKLHEPGKPTFDRVEYMKVKLDRYVETGNIEALVDVANLALLEFEEGQHPKRHFESLDDTSEHAKPIRG